MYFINLIKFLNLMPYSLIAFQLMYIPIIFNLDYMLINVTKLVYFNQNNQN